MTIRGNGSYLGKSPSAIGSGVWDLRSHFRYINENSWPKTGGDEYWDSVVLLLLLEGENNSTTFTDSSADQLSVTRIGNATISTAQSVVGSSSALLDGSGDFLQTASSSAFDIGSGNYTAECWFRVTGDPASAFSSFRRTIFSNYVNGSSGITVYITGTSTAAYTKVRLQDGDTFVTEGDATISKNTWHHVAFVKSGSVCTLYLDGISVSTGTRGTFGAASSSTFRIGRVISAVSAWDFPGYIDGVRVTKAARYTSNFTPPTSLPNF